MAQEPEEAEAPAAGSGDGQEEKMQEDRFFLRFNEKVVFAPNDHVSDQQPSPLGASVRNNTPLIDFSASVPVCRDSAGMYACNCVSRSNPL